MKKLLFAIALLGMAMSCTMVNEKIDFGKNIIKVTSDSETRMAIQDAGDGVFTHNWEKGDAIVIYDGATPLKYEIVGEGGDTKADFAGEALSGNTKLYPAFYPYADCIDITEGQNLFVYEFPSVIKKAAENYEQNVMIGLCDGSNVQMKNCASYVKFSFYTDEVSFVDAIQIEAIGGEPLCGKFRFGIDGATGLPFAIPDQGLTAENSKVTIQFEEAEMLTANATTFYVALPPVELSKGLKFTFKGSFYDESELEFISSTATLERNVVLDFDEIRTVYHIEPEAVAVIGETKYKTLQEAFAAASESDEDATIQMVFNVYLAEGVTLDNVNDKVITLDLNGYKITAATDFKYVITAKSDLVVTDSRTNGAIRAMHSAIRANTGKLTINGGVFSGDGYISDGSGVIYSYGEGGQLTINGGVINCTCGTDAGRAINATNNNFMYGGTINCEGEGYAIRQYNAGTFVIDGEGVVIYSNSNAQAPVSAVSTSSLIDFKKGFVYADGDAAIINDAAKVSVSGGHFNKAVIAIEGYESTENAVTGPDGRSYSYAIAPAKDLAQVNGTNYNVFAKAVEAANNATEDVTITLLRDVNLGTLVTTNNVNGKKITLDLAGYTITSTGTYAISNSTTELVITGNGKIDATEDQKGAVRNYQSGTLTIESGEICGYGNNSNGVVYSYGGGLLNIKGGNIHTVSESTGRAVNATATVSVTGGKISSDAGYALRIYGPATATIDGEPAIYAKAQCPVTGADNSGSPTINFKSGYAYCDGTKEVFSITSGGKLTVSGGYFNKRVNTNIESGKACMEVSPSVTGPDGRSYGFEVKEGKVYVARVTGASYDEQFTDCTEAVTAAMALTNSTITLLGDCGYTFSENQNLGAGKSLTLDLNGKTLSFSKYRIDVDGGNFTLTDSKGGGLYVNTSTGGYFGVKVISGSFTVNNGATIEARGSSATVQAQNGSNVTIDGTVMNTGTSYAMSLTGGTVTVNGGVVYSAANYTCYLSTNISTLNIHGGVFISETDGKFVLYTTTEGKKHVLNVDNAISEPYFYGGGINDDAQVKYQDRLLYIAYSTTKSIKAGYTSKHYWVNKTNSAASNGGVDSGYSVVTLGTPVTYTFQGKTYEFGYQVQKDK